MGKLALEKCADMLQDFGLTLNQAKVYLAAVQLGMAPVSKISAASNVRREDTYRILPGLEKLRLIEKLPGTPVKIRAKSIEEALSLLIERWNQMARQKESVLVARKVEFLQQYRTQRKPKLDEQRDHFALLLDKDMVVSRVKTMITNAEKEVALTSSADEMRHLLPASFTEELLQTMGKKKLKTRIILEVPNSRGLIRNKIKRALSARISVDLRYTCRRLSHCVIVDFAQVLMATSPEPSMGKLPYLWTDNPSFADLLQRHFEELWHACEYKDA